MAKAPLQLELCSPAHPPLSFEVTEVVVPGAAGIFTVLSGHTPLLTTLSKGALIARLPDGEDRFLAVHDGFAEVLDNRISILADTMELAENIDLARAEAAAERARERLRKPSSELDVARAEAALARSLARLQAHAGGES